MPIPPSLIRSRAADSRRPGPGLHGSLLYREEQSVGWPWPGMFLVLLCAFTFATASASFGFGMWTQLVEGRPWGRNPMPNGALLVVGTIAILVSLLPSTALLARLTVEVRTDGIEIRLTRAFGSQFLARESVSHPRIVRLGFLDVGRTQRWNRRVYRMAGVEGVELSKADGSGVVVISSEHPQTFLRAVQAMLGSKPGQAVSRT